MFFCRQLHVLLLSIGSFSNDDGDGKKKRDLKINTCATVTILRLSHLVRIVQC